MKRVALVLLLLAMGQRPALAEEPRLHPPFPLKDVDGENVLERGTPVSPCTTCAGCHDTDYIATHSYHAEAVELMRWDPLRYGTETFDKADAGPWLQARGRRYVGGRGGLEMDCFLCHLEQPAFEERATDIAAGRFAHAATATLLHTGLVTRRGEGFSWDQRAFNSDGTVDLGRLVTQGHPLGRPTAQTCGQCHGPTPSAHQPIGQHDTLGRTNLETRGQVFTSQRMRDSALNLAGKERLERPFDVHAERLLACSDCHHAPNHPAYAARSAGSGPGHLAFDARRPSIAEFLRTPNHHFARGRDGSIQNCADCHAVGDTHEWLPAAEAHMQAMRCEVCHVPHVHAPARRVTDWTILPKPGTPRIEYRGVTGPVEDAASLVTGFRPLLLPRKEADGRIRLTTYNLIAFWYWVAGDARTPVPMADLERALFAEGAYHPAILQALDEDGDGRVNADEVALDTPTRVAAVRERLLAVGVANPAIASEMRPYGLHHTVATGAFATRDCATCHADNSRVASAIDVASFAPGGVLPTWAGDDRVRPTGSLDRDAAGGLRYTPAPAQGGLYVVGHDHVRWIDVLGKLAILLVLIGALTHGALRVVSVRRRRGA